MIDDPQNKAAQRPSMRQQLKAFVSTCRAIARLTMGVKDASLFKVNKNKKPRLQHLGIYNHVPMVSFQVVVAEETKKGIAHHIIRSQARRSLTQAHEIVQQRQTVKLRKRSVVNRTRWSRSIKERQETRKQRKIGEDE